MRRFSPFAGIALALLVSTSLVIAAPPEGRGNGVGRGRGDNAASALDRRTDGLSRRPTDVGRSPAGLDRRPVTPVTTPGGTDSATDRGSRGLGRGTTSPGNLSRPDASQNRAPSERPTPRGHGGGLLGRFFGTPDAADIPDGDVLDPPDSPLDDTLDNDVTTTDDMPTTDRLRGRERFALTQADRLLAKRLADIDHLRDVAMRNGNTRLLDQADYLEQLARNQYARRTVGYDVPGTDTPMDPTDPMTPTDPTFPMDPTDPMTPTDPTDPMDPTDPTFPMDPTDPMTPTDPTDPMDPTDPIEPDPIVDEPGAVILGDIEPVEEPLP